MNDREFLQEINKEPRVLSNVGVERCLDGANAFWLYSGEPEARRPHAELTSGKHSNGYINVGSVLKTYPGVRRAFAQSLIFALDKFWNKPFNQVVGADTSSTELAVDVARIVNAEHIAMIKREDRQKKWQAWHPDNRGLEEKDVILHIEELLTTSFSAVKVREGIRRRNADSTVHFVPFLPVVVERSDPDNRVIMVENSKVLPLLQLNIWNYDPDQCPYCAVGSKAIKPKEGNNWSILTGK